MKDNTALACLFGVLDTLGAIARAMHPRRLEALIETLGDQDARLNVATAESEQQVALAARLALQACAGLRAAPEADNPIALAYRAMRQYSRSIRAGTCRTSLAALPQRGRRLAPG